MSAQEAAESCINKNDWITELFRLEDTSGDKLHHLQQVPQDCVADGGGDSMTSLSSLVFG